MKAIVEQPDLHAALNAVSRALPHSPVILIVENILVTAEESSIHLTATDLEKTIEVQVPAETESGRWSLTIPGRMLTKIAATLPTGPVTLTPGTGTNVLQIAVAGYSARVAGYPSDSFPSLEAASNEKTLATELTGLSDAIKSVVFATATDSSRPVLEGVEWTIADGNLTMAAADGYRLAQALMSAGTQESWPKIIIPARALAEVAHLFPGEVQVEIGTQHASFRGRTGTGLTAHLTSLLITGTFPNVAALIPTSYTTAVAMSREALLAGVKRAGIFAVDASDVVHLTPEDDGLRIWTAGAERGRSTETVETISGEGTDAIALNATYLVSALAVAPASTVQLEWSAVSEDKSSGKPLIIRADREWLALIMPMQTS